MAAIWAAAECDSSTTHSTTPSAAGARGRRAMRPAFMKAEAWRVAGGTCAAARRTAATHGPRPATVVREHHLAQLLWRLIDKGLFSRIPLAAALMALEMLRRNKHVAAEQVPATGNRVVPRRLQHRCAQSCCMNRGAVLGRGGLSRSCHDSTLSTLSLRMCPILTSLRMDTRGLSANAST